jgi:hypothetical protein
MRDLGDELVCRSVDRYLWVSSLWWLAHRMSLSKAIARRRSFFAPHTGKPDPEAVQGRRFIACLSKFRLSFLDRLLASAKLSFVADPEGLLAFVRSAVKDSGAVDIEVVDENPTRVSFGHHCEVIPAFT